jgi:hypothetical protein
VKATNSGHSDPDRAGGNVCEKYPFDLSVGRENASRQGDGGQQGQVIPRKGEWRRGLNDDGCARVGDVVGWRSDSRLDFSLKSRTCGSGDNAKHETIASFIPRYWLGLPRVRGTQRNVISSPVDSVTRKPKRNGGRGGREDEVEQVNGRH